MDKRYTTRVVVPLADGGICEGTAYPVAPRLFLTARHVVAPEEERHPDRPIVLELEYLPEEDWQFAVAGDPILPADESLDVALIRTEEEVGEGLDPNLLLSRLEPESDLRWETMGFPVARVGSERVEATSVLGNCHGVPRGEPRMELDVDLSAEVWEGLSGAPVFVGGRIQGVIFWDPDLFEKRRLHATTSAAFLKDPRLLAALEEAGFRADRAHDRLWQDALRELQDRENLVTFIAERAGLEHRTAHDVLTTFWGRPARELRAVLHAAGRDPELRADAARMAQWLLVACQDWSSFVARIPEGSREVHRFPLHDESIAELIFGQLRGVPAVFRKIHEEDETRFVGRGSLPHGLEGGPDRRNEKFLEDVFLELGPLIGVGRRRWMRIVQCVVAHKSLSKEDGRKLQELKSALRAACEFPDPARNHVPRYVLLACEENSELAAERDQQAAALKRVLPELDVIRADYRSSDEQSEVVVLIRRLFA